MAGENRGIKLKIQNVSKNYDARNAKVTALNQVDLEMK